MYISSFRKNDLDPSGGKQIEFNKKVSEEFFGFTESSYNLTFECYSLLDPEIYSEVEVFLSRSDGRGDYKIYKNEDGTKDLKQFLLNDLGLTKDSNLSDYFAVIRKGNDLYEFYYIPKDSLFENFIKRTFGGSYIFSETHLDANASSLPPLQAIYYGAPGTGKSYKIKGLTKGETIRTTFHPDSDYSTFMGAYKPTMEEVLRTESSSPQVKEKRIVYSFVPQAFLKAYVQAWAKYPAPQYLVIEEINRGNCAQIFGDLFQLLDRNGEGFSEYPIMADTEICRYLRDEFSNGNFGPNKGQRDDIDAYYRGEYDSVVEDVQVGKLLLLPCNLHILATMNTSDQSLFPIDSAFKRRWTWEYIPIRNAGRGWVIRADGRAWDWWSFLERINEEIGNATESEDKKLGYYFVRPTDDRTIAAETFVGKVLFYLWNDVIKNYGFNGDVLQAGDKEKLMTFPMFYETEREGQQVNEALVAQFLSNLQVAQLPSADEHGEKGSSDEGMQEA